MTDREPAVASPDIDDGRAAAVIGSLHAEKVVLRESRFDRLHPVAAILVRRSGIAPEFGSARAGGEHAGIAIGPAAKAQDPGAGVAIRDAHQRDAGMALIQRRLHGLLDAVDGGPRQCDPRGRTVDIGDAAPRLIVRIAKSTICRASPSGRPRPANTRSGPRRSSPSTVVLPCAIPARGASHPTRCAEPHPRRWLPREPPAEARQFQFAPARAHDVARGRARRPAEQTVDGKSCRESEGLCSWTVA